MLFNSLGFIFLFAPVALIGFFILARRSQGWAAGWLALVSVAFYGSWDYHYIPLLLMSVVLNFMAGTFIAAAPQPRRRQMLIAALAANLILLGYFKYANFFVSNFAALAGTNMETLGIVLPIGISFFTFTQIAFLVDTYQGKVKEYKFVHYLLFVTYFPHLVAGPVLHHKEMMPQFGHKNTYQPSAENLAVGFTIFVIGLVKKVLIADNVAPLANTVFEHGANPAFIEAWIGAIAYTLQLYFDFSGYSDMAIGLSRLFGVQLPLNFNSPYKANNVIDFWRRWHMTLSHFLRDYLYIPLGGNRNGSFARYRNLMITMLLGGLWHGAGWTFVIWGGLHGLYLALNHLWHFARKRLNLNRPFGIPGQLASRSLTLLAVVVAWVVFRAPDFPTAIDVLSGMVGLHGISLPEWSKNSLTWLAGSGIPVRFDGVRWIDFGSFTPPLLLAAMAIALFGPNTQEIMARYRPCLESVTPAAWPALNWLPSKRWAIAISVGFVGCVLNLNRVTEFLYFQF